MMETKKASLQQKDFAILETNFHINEFSQESVNGAEVMESWNVDIDFDIDYSDTDDFHKIKVVMVINKENLPGYYIKTVGMGLFIFGESSEASTDPKELQKMLFFSGVSICISSIRAYIANITSYSILGKYTIPTIDMLELLKSKIEK